MRAAIVDKNGKISIVDIPKPTPANGEVLVRITTAGVCHSDLHLAKDDWINLPKPIHLGHEGIGIIEELGSGTESQFQKGDRVIIGLGGSGSSWCGKCEYCLAGKPMHCPKQKNLFGVFGEYVSAWAIGVVKIPDELNDTEVPLACGGLSAYSAIKKLADYKVTFGKTVAIIGAAGGLGHYAVQIAKSFGYKVIGIDVGSEKLEFVKKLGADHAVDANEAAKFVKEKFRGVHASIVFASNISAYQLGLNLLKIGGVLIGVGMPSISEGAISIVPYKLVLKNLHIVASLTGTVVEMRELVQLAVEGKVKTHVGRVANLSEIEQVFEEMKEGKFLGRAIINDIMK